MASLLLEESVGVMGANGDYLNTIKVCSDFLLRLVNNILDFSKLESSMMTLESTLLSQHPFPPKKQQLIFYCKLGEPVNIRECLAIVINLLSPTASESGLDVYYTVDYGKLLKRKRKKA